MLGTQRPRVVLQVESEPQPSVAVQFATHLPFWQKLASHCESDVQSLSQSGGGFSNEAQVRTTPPVPPIPPAPAAPPVPPVPPMPPSPPTPPVPPTPPKPPTPSAPPIPPAPPMPPDPLMPPAPPIPQYLRCLLPNRLPRRRSLDRCSRRDRPRRCRHRRCNLRARCPQSEDRRDRPCFRRRNPHRSRRSPSRQRMPQRNPCDSKNRPIATPPERTKFIPVIVHFRPGSWGDHRCAVPRRLAEAGTGSLNRSPRWARTLNGRPARALCTRSQGRSCRCRDGKARDFRRLRLFRCHPPRKPVPKYRCTSNSRMARAGWPARLYTPWSRRRQHPRTALQTRRSPHRGDKSGRLGHRSLRSAQIGARGSSDSR